jgi:adenylosuccinate lyase
VVLPDAFFALDGLYETTFAVVRDFGVYPGVIEAELSRYLPFLATTALLVHAVRGGMGREQAHAVIKEHAVATALQLREGKGDGSDLLRRLGADDRFPGQTEDLIAIAQQAAGMLGTIDNQIKTFCKKVGELSANRPDASYTGADIL